MKHASFSERQAIRLAAARLFEQGCYPISEIQRILGVSNPTIFGWHRLWKEHGVDGLKIGTTGPKCKISDEQLKQVEEELIKGAKAQGYDTDIWTLERIAILIEKIAGVRYHQSHVWLIMKKIGWTCQKPERKALQRDEEAIENWKAKKWPVIKKGQKRKEPL